MSIFKKLQILQSELSIPKNRYNQNGEFSYRSCEDILKALKPLLKANNLVVQLSDSIEGIGDRFYVEATATITDVETGESTSCSACAREIQEIVGMHPSQITGASSSYARKYALCGLFAIDGGEKDPDAEENGAPPAKKENSSPTPTAPPKTMDEAFKVSVTTGFSAGKTLKEVYDAGRIKTIFWIAKNDPVASEAALFIIKNDEQLRALCTGNS